MPRNVPKSDPHGWIAVAKDERARTLMLAALASNGSRGKQPRLSRFPTWLARGPDGGPARVAAKLQHLHLELSQLPGSPRGCSQGTDGPFWDSGRRMSELVGSAVIGAEKGPRSRPPAARARAGAQPRRCDTSAPTPCADPRSSRTTTPRPDHRRSTRHWRGNGLGAVVFAAEHVDPVGYPFLEAGDEAAPFCGLFLEPLLPVAVLV